jgi:DNA-nicking Smr family endonuclease
MLEMKCGNCIEVNIHGMTAKEARRYLERLLSRAGKDVVEVKVIHGYNGGQVLRDMVRKDLKHPRISAKLVSLNPGETRILLRQEDSSPSVRKKRVK